MRILEKLKGIAGVLLLVLGAACAANLPTQPGNTEPPPTGGGPCPGTGCPQQGITFRLSEDMSMPASDMDVWTVRGLNSILAVKQMSGGDNSAPNNPGLHAMRRLNGPATIVYDKAQMGETEIAKLRTGAVKLQNATGFPVGVEENPVSGTATIRAVIDPTIPGTAQTLPNAPNGVMVGATISFLSKERVTDFAVGHELGHAFGLDHWVGAGLMGTIFSKDFTLDFSQPEKDNIAMMLKVTPGTAFPSDQGVTYQMASPGQTRVEPINCFLQ